MKQKSIKLTHLVLCFLMATIGFSQEKITKYSKSLKVDKNVAIELNTNYTNIIFDTWNKNAVSIEAYITGDDVSKEDLQKVADEWNLNIEATTNKVTITAKGDGPMMWHFKNHGEINDAISKVMEELKFELADLQNLNVDVRIPPMPELANMPPMPPMPPLPDLPEGAADTNFDYDAYKKDGEAYLKEYSKRMEKVYNKDYAKKMEAWGEKFGKEFEENYAKQMEAWGEKFGKKFGEKYGEKMEAWGERYAKQMEKRAERMEAQAEHREKAQEAREKLQQKREELRAKQRAMMRSQGADPSKSKIKKTIKIRMPKDAKLQLNVRHGALEFATNIDDLKAELSYSKLTAESINGSKTSINASYSPVHIKFWNMGELHLNYVQDAKLEEVKNLVLTANTSNVKIDNFFGNAVINSNIGDLLISKISNDFTNLNLTLENSESFVSLPEVNYLLQYKGTRSKFLNSETSPLDPNVTSYSNQKMDSNKTILIDSRFSEVTLE